MMWLSCLETLNPIVVKNISWIAKFWKYVWEFSENLNISKNLNFPKDFWKSELFSKNCKSVMLCLLVTLVTCLKGHKSLRVLCASVFQQSGVRSQSVTDKVTFWAVREQLYIACVGSSKREEINISWEIFISRDNP